MNTDEFNSVPNSELQLCKQELTQKRQMVTGKPGDEENNGTVQTESNKPTI